MSFAWPLWLLALLLIPAAAALYWLAQRRRSKYAVRFTNLDLLANVVEKEPAWRRHVAPALYLLALATLIVTVARPQGDQNVPKEEATVILVTDVSGSMNATDVDPSRLIAARESARALVDDLPARFQIALISFSSNVRTIVPPTTNKEDVKKGLASLSAAGGTAMGDALMQAIAMARPAGPAATTAPGAAPSATPTPTPVTLTGDERPVVIVLLSDGANSAGQADPIDAANEALAQGISIFTVALGTAEGVVDITDNFGRTRRIQVPPDEETLKEIAQITEGSFFSAPSASDLEQVYQDLGSKIGFDKKKTDIGYGFAGVAALLMLAGGAVSVLWFNRFP